MKKIVISLFLVSLVVGCSEQKQPEATGPDTTAGKAIAEAKCAGCHGLDGKGVTEDIPHLAAQVSEYLIASLNAYKEGKRTHAALKDMARGMSQSDMENVVAYYAGLPPIKATTTAAVEPSPYEKGEAAASACSSCHGEDGNSTTAGIPNLAGQQPVYFISAVQAYLQGKRKIATQEKEVMVSALNQVDIEAMALYYASQVPAQRQAPAVGDPQKGEPLSANCGSCHGEHGVSSDLKVPSLAAQDAEYLVNAVKAYQGDSRKQDDMHQFLATVSNDDIKNIAAFYSVQPSKAAQEEPVSIKDLAAQCDRCHTPGPGGETTKVAFPKIDGQHKAYLIKALKEYRDDKRESSTMHKMSLPYSDAIIESLAALYAGRQAQ